MEPSSPSSVGPAAPLSPQHDPEAAAPKSPFLGADAGSVNKRNAMIAAMGVVSISIVWPVIDQFLPLFLQAGNPEWERKVAEDDGSVPNVRGFGLSTSLAFFITTAHNLIDMFLQPWAGATSDRTWNRFGRRRPWMMVGLPIAAVSMVFIPVARELWVLILFYFAYSFGMAIRRTPTVALLGDLFPPEQRSKVNGLTSLGGALASVAALAGSGYSMDEYGRAVPFLGASALMVLFGLVPIVLLREQQHPLHATASPTAQATQPANLIENLRTVWNAKDRRGFYVLLGLLFAYSSFSALQTGFSTYAVLGLGLSIGDSSAFAAIFAGCFIAMVYPAGVLATRFGRWPTIRAGILICLVTTFIGYFIITDKATFIIALVIMGGATALVQVNALPLVYDVGDEARIGAYTGLYYFCTNSASFLGPNITALMMEENPRMLLLGAGLYMFVAYAIMFFGCNDLFAACRSKDADGLSRMSRSDSLISADGPPVELSVLAKPKAPASDTEGNGTLASERDAVPLVSVPSDAEEEEDAKDTAPKSRTEKLIDAMSPSVKRHKFKKLKEDTGEDQSEGQSEAEDEGQAEDIGEEGKDRDEEGTVYEQGWTRTRRSSEAA